MNKKICVISCPIDCYSGYSARSRDFVKSLIQIKGDEWDIKILPQRWGKTNMGYLDKHKETDLQSRIIPKLTEKPEIWVQITVPNEFQPIGKYNIGVTAGIETTICDPSWIEGINRMNLVLVSSEHAKKIFLDTKYSKQDNETKKIIEVIECKTKIEVLFEGVDLNKYKKVENNKFDLSKIEENFCFLFTGHWLQGEIGHDRKNVGMTVKCFLEAFKDTINPPALILKTGLSSNSIIERDMIIDKINKIQRSVHGKSPKFPNIYLVHGELSDEEVNDLYNHPKIKSHISLTRGEGFGRPLLECTLSQKPLIVSNWSGHLDFLKPELNVMINGNLEKLHPTSVVPNMLLNESSWFKPNYDEAIGKLKDVYINYKKYTSNAKKQSYYSKTNFSFDKMTERLNTILEENIILEVKLTLPPNLSLPNLKKI